jgi:hypothetical protein
MQVQARGQAAAGGPPCLLMLPLMGPSPLLHCGLPELPPALPLPLMAGAAAGAGACLGTAAISTCAKHGRDASGQLGRAGQRCDACRAALVTCVATHLCGWRGRRSSLLVLAPLGGHLRRNGTHALAPRPCRQLAWAAVRRRDSSAGHGAPQAPHLEAALPDALVRRLRLLLQRDVRLAVLPAQRQRQGRVRQCGCATLAAAPPWQPRSNQPPRSPCCCGADPAAHLYATA